jgi:hypothetical protein
MEIQYCIAVSCASEHPPPSRVPVLNNYRSRSPRVRQQNALQVATQHENDLRIPITSLPALTAPFLHIPFFSTSRLDGLALSKNAYRLCARVRPARDITTATDSSCTARTTVSGRIITRAVPYRGLKPCLTVRVAVGKPPVLSRWITAVTRYGTVRSPISD